MLKETQRLIKSFKEDLFDYTEMRTDTMQREKAFEMAWERGHSEGFSSIFHEFLDLAELIMLAPR